MAHQLLLTWETFTSVLVFLMHLLIFYFKTHSLRTDGRTDERDA